MSNSLTPTVKHPLSGARERLKRADEDICNLEREVGEFLRALLPVIFTRGPDDKPIVKDSDRKAFEVLRQRAIASAEVPRFGVLAGEIVHHFRSAFDHVVWQLSSADAKKRFSNQIEFPICESEPECFIREPERTMKHSAYCRKIIGVSSLTALARIDSLQPYHRSDLYNSPLLQIHLLDKFDKHRELVGVDQNIFSQKIYSAVQPFRTVKDSASGGFKVVGPLGPMGIVKVEAKLSLDVSFAQLRKWESKPLLMFLKELFRFTSDSIESFADEFG